MGQCFRIVIRCAVGVAVACALTAAPAALVAPAGAATANARAAIGRAPRLPAGARTTGKLAPSTPLRLLVALQPRDPAGLQALATAVSTPGSPQYRQYLSVAQFAGRFGATESSIAAVQSALRAAGLTVGAPMANHLALQVSGTAGTVQKAFATRLSSVKLASGRRAYANMTAPVLPRRIAADIQGVTGLNDLVTEQHPEAFARTGALDSARAGLTPNVATGGPQPCLAADEAASDAGYTADLIASAYGFSSLYGAGDLGAGQTIALYELEPYDPADVSAYQSCYGTNVSITNVPVDSPPAYTSGEDDSEAALDIEQLIGLAPSAKILVYQAPNNATGQLQEWDQIISQDQAKVISSSWGECEAAVMESDASMLSTENTEFQEAATQGQSIFVASGDAGSSDCVSSRPSDTALAVSDPASQPFATGVGGTSLFAGSPSNADFWTPGQPVEQSVWNDQTLLSSTGSASGGGISNVWPMPSYQSGAAASVGVINASSSGSPCGQSSYCREVPDVSADGDPATGYVVYADGGWEVAGGTSAAAPLWAAFTGLVNADSTCHGQPVGFLNPALYQLAGTAYASNLSDVTLASPVTGADNNDALGVNGGLYAVGTGYDMTTGLGTPIAPQLATSLCEFLIVTVTNPGAQSGTVGSAQSLQIQTSSTGGLPVTYKATGLPAGLTINSASGLISGIPRTAKTSTVTVSASDGLATGSTEFTWAIAGHPKVTSVSLTGVAHDKPRLRFTVTAGSNAPALKTITVALPSGLKFAKRPKRGVSATARFKSSEHAGKLTLTLRSASRRVRVVLASPAFMATATVASKARRHRLGKLRLSIGTRNAANTPFTIVTRVSDRG